MPRHHTHTRTPLNTGGYISQLNTLYGPIIDGKVEVHKMGTTVLRHLQINQYLRYWKRRTGAGVWAYKTDIEGHAAACRRAQKSNPKLVLNPNRPQTLVLNPNRP